MKHTHQTEDHNLRAATVWPWPIFLLIGFNILVVVVTVIASNQFRNFESIVPSNVRLIGTTNTTGGK
jgi:uncharacterized protein YpmS